ncbi:undecaprenyl-diphosphate phosphatase [Mobilitalea sibirica]|uniref:Undecaprenyl-diphosphatase n=1 Tax=Mobilitalea sibirica TaxID=1462919 RepID=A0A8J7KX91_9FIRM|nr:undecaprenyl-diphosphate phosphatase [Mobilitalea sibirica]MBH1942280.1 undecaprenyl-diphosphate phosphatase [Mobilitalea sibirica]
MDLLESILMGLVQGLAEFLPISSSGHLAIMKQILNLNMDTGLLFDVMLHFGTMVAIFVVFWKDILDLITEGFKIIGDSLINTRRFIRNLFSKDKVTYKNVITTPYRRFVLLVIVSTIPTGIIGVVFNNAIEEAGKTLLVPGLSLIFTAILLTIADRVHTGQKTEETASYKNALFLGIAQGVATLPGISRSGTTITAGLLSGFDRTFAVKYSFIMSIPAVLGAVVYEMKDFSMDLVNKSEITGYIVGTLVAAVVGYISIKTMLVIVRGKKFKYFAYYCFAIGLIALSGHFFL